MITLLPEVSKKTAGLLCPVGPRPSCRAQVIHDCLDAYEAHLDFLRTV